MEKEEEIIIEAGLEGKRFIAKIDKNGEVDFYQDKKDKTNGIIFFDSDVIKALKKIKGHCKAQFEKEREEIIKEWAEETEKLKKGV